MIHDFKNASNTNLKNDVPVHLNWIILEFKRGFWSYVRFQIIFKIIVFNLEMVSLSTLSLKSWHFFMVYNYNLRLAKTNQGEFCKMRLTISYDARLKKDDNHTTIMAGVPKFMIWWLRLVVIMKVTKVWISCCASATTYRLHNWQNINHVRWLLKSYTT